VNTALALDGDSHEALYIQALLAWYADEDLDTAIAQLDALADTEVYSPYLNLDFEHDINLDKARIFDDAGELEEALEAFNALLEYWSYVDWLLEERADLHLEMGDTEAARGDLERARDITEDNDYRRELLQRIIALGPAPTSTPED
jgi:tetratricopeptide (TPR) repeat protein